jgi:hypothetical protein
MPSDAQTGTFLTKGREKTRTKTAKKMIDALKTPEALGETLNLTCGK